MNLECFIKLKRNINYNSNIEVINARKRIPELIELINKLLPPTQ